MTIRYTMIAIAIAILMVPSAFAVQQKTRGVLGQDTGTGTDNERPADYPNSKAKFEEFKDICGNGVHVVDFESLKSKYGNFKQWGTQAGRKNSYQHILGPDEKIELMFGNTRATLSGMSAVAKVTDNTGTFGGAFPTSDETFMMLSSGKGKKAEIQFSEPQAAFGFYVTDIEKNRLEIDLLRNGQEPEKFDFGDLNMSTGPKEPTAGISFVGVVDNDNPFNGIRLANIGPEPSEGFGFDDMVIAKKVKVEYLHVRYARKPVYMTIKNSHLKGKPPEEGNRLVKNEAFVPVMLAQEGGNGARVIGSGPDQYTKLEVIENQFKSTDVRYSAFKVASPKISESETIWLGIGNNNQLVLIPRAKDADPGARSYFNMEAHTVSGSGDKAANALRANFINTNWKKRYTLDGSRVLTGKSNVITENKDIHYYLTTSAGPMGYVFATDMGNAENGQGDFFSQWKLEPFFKD